MAAFKRFPDFPPEIRTQIWEEAATIPADDPIIADFGGTLFKTPPIKDSIKGSIKNPIKDPEPERLECRFYLRYGSGCESLGTLRANLESREASLRMNPDFLQFNSGPKLYFNAERNIIHFDFKSLYFIGLYFDQNLHNEHLRVSETSIQVRFSPLRRKHDLVRNLRGFCGIRTISVPHFIYDSWLAIVVLLFSAGNTASAFRKVTRIIPKSLPNNRNHKDTWKKFMDSQIGDLFFREYLPTSFEGTGLAYDRTTYSRKMWQLTISSCIWPAWWPTWMMEERERIGRLFEAPPS